MQWRPKSRDSRLFTQPFIQAQIKEIIKALRHWLLVTGEFSAQRASKTEMFPFDVVIMCADSQFRQGNLSTGVPTVGYATCNMIQAADGSTFSKYMATTTLCYKLHPWYSYAGRQDLFTPITTHPPPHTLSLVNNIPLIKHILLHMQTIMCISQPLFLKLIKHLNLIKINKM